jgi:hypothetical protein
MIVIAVLTAFAATACGSTVPAGHLMSARCEAPRGSVSLTLTDTIPVPRVTAKVGRYIAVTVPAWHWGTATNVQATTIGMLRQVCTVVTHGHGRLTVLKAARAGSSHLGATVRPASNLFMPAWGGIVIVTPSR